MEETELSQAEPVDLVPDDFRRMASIQRRLAAQMVCAAYQERFLQSAVRFDALADEAVADKISV